mmetsp:Transcript_6336/g.9853  ORF Transcript_6336/g.9853 Transcript_6336/m.9853 type:complete len:126 (-) Transcript_6336:1009-1386(-)
MLSNQKPPHFWSNPSTVGCTMHRQTAWEQRSFNPIFTNQINSFLHAEHVGHCNGLDWIRHWKTSDVSKRSQDQILLHDRHGSCVLLKPLIFFLNMKCLASSGKSSRSLDTDIEKPSENKPSYHYL